ncbi:unnamed protein product [Durusdinium trenchii]|uniref:Uncharacterized protein n=1 Tax=Durusdinium trenchii TaxID=1381693 RepID=A0ABP0H779_9DINO
MRRRGRFGGFRRFGASPAPFESPATPTTSSGRSKRERRIYDLFFQPGSHEVLYETLKLFADRSDARAAVNALCSLARLDNQRLEQVTKPGQRPARGSGNFTSKLALEAEAALCQRLERLLEQRESLPPLFVANFLWSVAKVAAREPFACLVERICHRAATETPKFTARDLSTALWALAVLVADTPHRNVADTCALPGFLSQRLCLLAGYRELKTFDLTQSLWAAAKLANQGVPGMAKLMLELVKAALGEASTFECHSISVSLWALGLSEELHPLDEVQRFAHELAAAGQLLAFKMNSQMLANCAWGAARVAVKDVAFYEAMATTGLERRKKAETTVLDQHIFNLAYSFVKAEVSDASACRQFLLRTAEDGRPGGRMEQMAHYHLSGLIRVLAKAFTPDTLFEKKVLSRGLASDGMDKVPQDLAVPPSVVTAVRTALSRVAAQHDSETFTPKDLSWCVWSGARCLLSDAVLLLLPKTLERLATSAEAELTAQDFGSVLWSIAAAELGRPQLPELRPFLSRAHASMVTGLTGEGDLPVTNLCNAVWAVAKADLRPSHTLLELAIRAVSEAGGSGDTVATLRRNALIVAIARVCTLHPVSFRCAAFVQLVYEDVLRHFDDATSESAISIDAEHLAWLRLGLVYLPSFRSQLKRPPRSFPEHLNQYRRIGATVSDLQQRVATTLRYLKVRHILPEALVEGGLCFGQTGGRGDDHCLRAGAGTSWAKPTGPKQMMTELSTLATVNPMPLGSSLTTQGPGLQMEAFAGELGVQLLQRRWAEVLAVVEGECSGAGTWFKAEKHTMFLVHLAFIFASEGRSCFQRAQFHAEAYDILLNEQHDLTTFEGVVELMRMVLGVRSDLRLVIEQPSSSFAFKLPPMIAVSKMWGLCLG